MRLKKRCMFIVGAPRSGTTLIRELIASNSDVICSLEETQFLPNLLNHWKNTNSRKRSDILRSILRTGYFDNISAPEKSEFVTDITRHLDKLTVEDIFRKLVCFREGVDDDCSVLVDKTPSYIRIADEVIECFNNPYFLFVIRDPRDVALSSLKAWGASPIRIAHRWNQFVDIYNNLIKLKDINLMLVKYENILQNPDKQVHMIEKFYNASSLTKETKLRRGAEKFGDAKNLLEVSSNNMEKWRSGLDSDQIRKIEEICFQNMKKFRYKHILAEKQSSVSKLTMCLLAILDFISSMVSYYKHDGLTGLQYRLRQLKTRI